VAALLGAACLAASASACGGGSKTISKADYLAQAKTVCLKGNRALTAASNDVIAKLAPGQKLSEPQIEDFVRKTVIPAIRDQIKQLRAIPPPKGEKGHVGEIYKALDKGLAELLSSLRIHGRTNKYFHQWIGVNSRLDALQAAVRDRFHPGRPKQEFGKGWSAGRTRASAKKAAERY